MEFLDIITSLLALTVLEIILGIDNLVFLSILTEKLPLAERRKARRWGLLFAWVTRLMLLASAMWLAHMTTPLFTIGDWHASTRDLFLFLGGSFLIGKATQEIGDEVGEGHTKKNPDSARKISFKQVVIQVALMDIIFSLDSVLTAIGLTGRFWVMAVAISLAIVIMIYAAETVSRFISRHPTIKMLALSFLILIGTVLVADAFALHIPRAYVYFAMGFSLSVEALNIYKRKRHHH